MEHFTVQQLQGYVARLAEMAKLTPEQERIIQEAGDNNECFPREEYHLGEGWVPVSIEEHQVMSAHARTCPECEHLLRDAEHFCTMNGPLCDTLDEYLRLCKETRKKLASRTGPRPDVDYD